MKLKHYSVLTFCMFGSLLTAPFPMWAGPQTEVTICSASVLNPTAVEIVFSNQPYDTRFLWRKYFPLVSGQ